jgi:hypothetical protein
MMVPILKASKPSTHSEVPGIIMGLDTDSETGDALLAFVEESILLLTINLCRWRPKTL